jgi:hypothetical protein
MKFFKFFLLFLLISIYLTLLSRFGGFEDATITARLDFGAAIPTLMTLHSAEDAIKQATEKGGWIPPEGTLAIEFWLPQDYAFHLQSPVFWQALGKARRWDWEGSYRACPIHGTKFYDPGGIESEGEGGPACSACPVDGDEWEGPALIDEWLSHALRYFETRLANGDLTAYWQSLP